MGSKTIKTALVVGAIATGFVAIGAVGPSAFAQSVGGFFTANVKAAGLIGTFITAAGTQLVLGAINKKLAPDIDLPEIDLLEYEEKYKENVSRLSCQIELTSEYDGLVAHLI